MSFFGGKSYSDSGRNSSSHHNSHSHARDRSPARSTSHGFYQRPTYARSSSSFFGGGGGGSKSGSRGIFGSSGGSSSYYKRRPRDGYISYLMHKLQRMVKELWYYARRHPIKAFFAIIVPLLSAGGAIGGLLRQFNIRLPGIGGSSGFGGSRGRVREFRVRERRVRERTRSREEAEDGWRTQGV